MATQAAIHKRNLESSILFMQEEHATTLKALHQEIHTLQKKCTDLTFQLTMGGCIGDEDLDSKRNSYESELTSYKSENCKLQLELEGRDKRIKALESDILSQKKKYLEVIRVNTQNQNSLKAELEAKCNNIAYLTTEYHKLKLKEKVDTDSADPSIRRTKVPAYLPAPPKEIQSKLRRNSRRGLQPDPHPQRPLRVNSGKSSGSSRSNSPDITAFVQKDETRPITDRRKQTTVLPPISRATTQEKGTVVVRQVVPAAHLARHPESTSPEITTLAVDRVSRGEPGLVHVPEARSTEYK